MWTNNFVYAFGGIGDNHCSHLRVKAHVRRREHQLLLLTAFFKFPNYPKSKNKKLTLLIYMSFVFYCFIRNLFWLDNNLLLPYYRNTFRSLTQLSEVAGRGFLICTLGLFCRFLHQLRKDFVGRFLHARHPICIYCLLHIYTNSWARLQIIPEKQTDFIRKVIK